MSWYSGSISSGTSWYSVLKISFIKFCIVFLGVIHLASNTSSSNLKVIPYDEYESMKLTISLFLLMIYDSCHRAHNERKKFMRLFENNNKGRIKY
jgi:hypothetical protein